MPETDPTPPADNIDGDARIAELETAVAALTARAERAERDLSAVRDDAGASERAAARLVAAIRSELDAVRGELVEARAEVERLSRPTVVTTVPTPPVLSEQERRQQRAELLLASLDAMPAAREHTAAEARCARALWAAETRGTTVPDWDGLEVPQRHAVVSRARTFLNSDEPAAALARELLGA